MNRSAHLEQSGEPPRSWIWIAAVFLAIQIGILVGISRWPSLGTVQPPLPAKIEVHVGPLSPPSPGPGRWATDPLQFAKPDPNGFSGVAKRSMPQPEYRVAEWSGRFRWLEVSDDASRLGSPGKPQVPSIRHTLDPLEVKSASANSTPLVLQPKTVALLRGPLRDWSFSNQQPLPSITGTEILPPTILELMVSQDGDVILTRLISSSGHRDADALALNWTRTMRLAPPKPALPSLSITPSNWTQGELIVDWNVEPPKP